MGIASRVAKFIQRLACSCVFPHVTMQLCPALLDSPCPSPHPSLPNVVACVQVRHSLVCPKLSKVQDVVQSARRGRRTLCDPYLNLFRGLIPPLGGTIDLSPILAFIVLDVCLTPLSACLIRSPVLLYI